MRWPPSGNCDTCVEFRSAPCVVVSVCKQWRGGGYFDGLACLADLQGDVDADAVTGGDDDCLFARLFGIPPLLR